MLSVLWGRANSYYMKRRATAQAWLSTFFEKALVSRVRLAPRHQCLKH